MNKKNPGIIDFGFMKIEIYNIMLFDRLAFEIQKRGGSIKNMYELKMMIFNAIEKEKLEDIEHNQLYKVVLEA